MGTGPNTSQLLLRQRRLPLGCGPAHRRRKTRLLHGGKQLQIPVTAENTEAAWRWIEFLTSDPECIQSYIVHTNRLPANQKFMTQWMRVLQNTPNPPEGVENYIEAAIHPDNYVDILSPHYAYFEQTAYPLIRNEVLQGQRDPRAVLEQLHQLMTARFAGN